MDNKVDKDRKVRIGITHGDINGIGYEVIIKSLIDPRINELFNIVVYGNSQVASYHKKSLNIGEFSLNLIKNADNANPKRSNIINIIEGEIKINLGKSSKTGGDLAVMSLEAAIKDIKANKIDAIVTAPINKFTIQSPDFHFPGHTEYFCKQFNVHDHLMLMVSSNIRIGVITGHVPLKDVSSKISKELILKKINILNKSLMVDFCIRRPKIAVLGLNPHAGDEGVLGNEEKDIIIPAINQAFNNKILAYGPFPADGFFGSADFLKFDGILAMYHDQGLIPFKTIAFDSGVNFTAGLPIVRTSPVHGTAYDIAGQNKANPDSFRAALYLAYDIFKNRQMRDELTENPL